MKWKVRGARNVPRRTELFLKSGNDKGEVTFGTVRMEMCS